MYVYLYYTLVRVVCQYKPEENFFEFCCVSSAANKRLHIQAAIKILCSGISDYSEIKGNEYFKMKNFGNWGAGEEGTGVLGSKTEPCEPKPSCVKFIQKDRIYLLNAIDSPNWDDVPYIKLISENGDSSV